jgi:23S rRNA (uracil1939-C5)-methyltransferase
MDLRIEQLVYKGDGLARTVEGKVVFLPFTLPEELVSVSELREKNGVFSGTPEKILSPSSKRIEPGCPYFGSCGGCQYQHIVYDEQLIFKRSILEEQLERFGGLRNLPLRETVPSSKQFSYRNHVQFHLDKEGKPGFQKALSHDVIRIDKCLIVEDTINELLQTLAFESDTGIERVAIRDDGNGTPVVFLIGSANNPPEFEVDFPLNVIYRSPAGDMVLSGERFNQFTVWDKQFQVSAGSFFQTNTEVAEKMAKIVCEKAETNDHTRLLDCYCGVGFFSRFLADRGSQIVGIESSEDACNDFAVNLDAYDNIELYQGNVEDVLPDLNTHPDLVVIDPPRAGIAQPAMKALMKAKPGQIIYVSCDPSTLARDLKIMTETGYSIESVTPVDMFPQTYHIESITNLKRKEKL